MEKLVEKAREQSEEIERLRAQLDLKDRRIREKEDELQEKDDDNAELSARLNEVKRELREESSKNVQSADNWKMQLAIEKQKAVQFENELILMKSKLDPNLQAASAISIGVSSQPSSLSLASTMQTPIQTIGMPYATSNYAPGVSTTFLSTVYSLPISSMSLNNTPGHNVSTMLTLSNTGTGTATASSMGMPINSIASTSTTSSTNTTMSSTTSTIYGVKLQKYKPTMDMETFVNRFEQYCLTQKIELIDKANLIIHALDDATFTVIQRELTDAERMNYDTVKRHLLKRFDVHKEIGQKRLLFRQAKREATKTLEEFYTHLLGLAAKAFPDESADTIDRMITDQFIVGCEVDRTRLHLIEKGPRTSREALALGIAHQAAIRYNESLKDTSTVSAVEYHVSATTANRPTRAHGRGRRVHNANPNQGYNQNNRWSNINNSTGFYGQQNYQPQQTYRQQYRSSVPNTQFQNGVPFFRSWGNNQRGSGRGPGRGSGRERGQFHGQWGNGSNNRNEEQGGQHYSTNGISSPSCPLYVNGIFGSVEIPILLDTGSAVTVIDEEIWKMMKAKDDKLEKVPFAIRSVTQHDIEILGQKEVNITFPTRKKNGRRNFKVTVLIAKGLLHKAILGLNFLNRFEAYIDISQNKMSLHNQGTKSVHELFQGKGGYRSVSVVLAQDIVVAARTERRVQCKVTEDIEDGNMVYFEPKQEILHTKPIYVAGAIDIVNKGFITAQLINPTPEGITLRRGTVVGKVELMDEAVISNIEVEEPIKSREWVEKIDIGDQNVNAREKKRIEDLLVEYKDVFSQGDNDLGRCGLISHSIEIVGEKPKRCGVRPLNPAMREVLKTHIDELKSNDLIQPSNSEYACPVVMVKKKDGSLRFCCDFRRLNDVTRCDSYPLPRISEVISTLEGAKVFSTLDLKSGYHQILMNPEDRHKTAFATQFGLYEWKAMPMGLKNAPATFERLMDLIMTGLNWKNVLIYLDDILIFGKDFDEHYDNLREVLDRLRRAKLKLSPKKCHLLKSTVTYLGHVINNGEIRPDPEKTNLIATYPVPKNIKEVRSFVSLASYYRKFVRNFAQIAKPLTCLLEKGKEFHWTLECQHAFDNLRSNLEETTKLTLPNFKKTFRLACDASGVALGAVLSQLDDEGKERPIAFASRILSKTERKWGITEREAFAIVWAVNYFRSYLLGNKFDLFTDHRPLTFLRTLKNPSPKIARWLLQLEEYEYNINFKEGKSNANADAMSRLPMYDEEEEVNTVQAIDIIELSSSLNLDEIREAQGEDEMLQEVLQILDTGNTDTVSSRKLWPFIEKLDELFVDDEILYRCVYEGHIQIILPPALHDKVLLLLHHEPTGGHLGVNRTVARFDENFYWPGMQKIVSNYIQSCLTCEKFKPSKENTKANLQPISSHQVLELVELDFIGPLTPTKQGHKYILSVIDHYSKYAVAYATFQQNTKTVIDCLKQYFSQFGIPERILTDQGRCFISQPFQDFLNLWGIMKATSTSYHPETQGLVERFNGTIISILKRYIYEMPDTWDENLPLATFAYNTSIQRINNFTPHEVMYGRKAKTSLSTLVKNNSKLSPAEYVLKVQRDLQRINTIIADNQQIASQKEQDRYNKKTGGNVFSVGDHVLLYNPAVKMGDSKKFAPCYQGPFVIQNKCGEVNFHIKPVDGTAKEQTVHQNRLKRYHMPTTTRAEKQPVRVHDNTHDDETESDEEEVVIRKVIINNTLPVQQEPKTSPTIPAPTARIKQDQPIEKTTTPGTTSENILQQTVNNDNTGNITSVPSQMINTPARSHVTNEQSETTGIRNDSTNGRADSSISHSTPLMEDNLWLLTPLPPSSPSTSPSVTSPPTGNAQENDTESFQSAKATVESSNGHSLDDTKEAEQDYDIDDVADETYQPMREFSPVLPRHQPVRSRRPPIRYPAEEHNINSITIQHNLPEEKKAKRKQGKQNTYLGLKLWQLTIIMLYFMLLPFSSASDVVTSETDLGSMFGPGHICGSAGHHTMYIALPDIPSCIWEDPRTKNVENVLITPFFPRTFSDPIKAYGCQVEVTTVTTFMGFFGTKSVLNREKMYRKLNLRDCWEEMSNLEKGVSNLKTLGHDTFTNDTSPFQVNYFWCCKEHVLIRYRLIIQKLKVRINFHNKHVVSSAFKMEGCLMDNNYCELLTVTIVWRTNGNDTCPLQEGNQVLGQCMGNVDLKAFTMVSEIGQFAVSGKRRLIQKCGFDLYETNEGIFIRIDQANITAVMAKRLRHGDHPIRTTSDIPLISFVAHELEDLMYTLYRKSWLSICYLTQQRVIYINHLATNPQQAYLAARMLMKTTNIMAHPAGQYLSAYECDKIEEYYLNIIPDKCYKSIPIRYQQHQREFERFILPATNDIILADSEIHCSKPVQMFMKRKSVNHVTELYVWNGSHLMPTTLNNTVTVQLVEQIPNITYLQLMSSRVVDSAVENSDILTELTAEATNMMLALAHVTNIDMVTLDSEMLVHAASSTVTAIRTTVGNVISHAYPFLTWLYKIFCILTVIVICIIVLFIAFKIWNCMQKRKAEANILRFVETLNTHTANKNENEIIETKM